MLSIKVRTPARVNIIGEYTDFNDGFVLPTSTALFTTVTARPRADRVVEVTSNTVGESASFDLDQIRHANPVSWLEYVKGVAVELQRLGIRLCGASLEVDSDIPLGGGLSSSASLELSVAGALLALADQNLSGAELARLCQRAEHDYAGVQCGIMDQFTLACAREGHAILLDCRSLEVEQVSLSNGIAFILTDSGVRHSLAVGAYNDRADECRAAVALLAENMPRLHQLRDLSEASLEANKAKLGELLYRRCRHVVTENRRVVETVMALKDCNLQRLGALISASHDSLRDDFEVSCDEIETLVSAANASEFVMGSRMIGAGFGGCVLSTCRDSDVDAVAKEILENVAASTGGRPWQHVVAAAAPTHRVANE